MKKVINLYKRYEEIINYLAVGILTTVISLVTYFICVHTFLDVTNAVELQIANIISWILSVIFAYVANRVFVFKSESNNYLKEIMSFFSARILTLLMDMAIMFVLVSLLRLNDSIAKIFSQVVIIVANYIFSKLFVFKK